MSRRELYLHIGTHKTGTTALQTFFAANRNRFKATGIVYPFDRIGGGEAGHYRLSWAVQLEGGIADERFPSDLQSSAEEWDFVLKQCDGPKALVSTEGFWDCRPEHVERIAELTSEFSVRIVVYLRRQDHFEDAWYNQLVKDRRCMKTRLAGGMFPAKEKFFQWANRFGRENVIIRPYEKQQIYRGTIFADFLHAVWGLELADEFIVPRDESNPRLHRVALEYRRLVNQLPLSTQQKFMTLAPLLEVSAQMNEQGRRSDPVLPPQERLEIVRRYNEFYSEIAREYAGRDDGRLFYDPLPNADEAWQPYECLTEEDARLINGYLTKHCPDVKNVIKAGIEAARKLENPDVADAVKRLMPGMVAVSATPMTVGYQKTLETEGNMQKPPKELYIHIGTHKTGTTALQQFFQINRAVLRQKGIEYPANTDNEAGHHRLGWSFHKEGGRPAEQFPADIKSAKEEWAPILMSDNSRILVSSETLYKCHPKDFAAIRKYTADFAVKIIIYLRRQDMMTNSIYNQIIKASARKLRDFDISTYNLNYLDCLDCLAATFGKENVIVRPYEKQQLYGGTIFADFLHFVFGLELTKEFKIPEGDINSRLHRTAWEYKRLVNYLRLPPKRVFTTLRPLLEISARFYEEGKVDDPLLSPEKRMEIVQEYARVNQRIARDYLGRPDGRLFLDPLPDIGKTWQPYGTLAEADVRLINGYLTKNYPHVMCTIIEGILNSRPAKDADVRDAIRCLLPGILETPLEGKKRRAALERRRTEIAGTAKGERFMGWLRRTLPEPLKKPARVVAGKLRQMSGV